MRYIGRKYLILLLVLVILGGITYYNIKEIIESYIPYQRSLNNTTSKSNLVGYHDVVIYYENNSRRFILNENNISISYGLVDYPGFIFKWTYREFYNWSDIVVLGEVINSTSYWIYQHPTKAGPAGIQFTIHRIKILKSFKGSIRGKYICIFNFFEGLDSLSKPEKYILPEDCPLLKHGEI
ncbi:hypothetical protein DRN87_02800 [Candidatus Geothermarchaeota archaeon]|nr:MAG: hypothetical protein DRN87_02800 [Candidatus Geothermarchaeota archaeon]